MFQDSKNISLAIGFQGFAIHVLLSDHVSQTYETSDTVK
jgi:hypothetical protein